MNKAQIIEKVTSGFLTGLGFTVALLLVVFLWEKQEGVDYLTSESGVSISEHRHIQTQEGLRVIGAVQNAGDDAWRLMSISVKFYDKNGNNIDSYSSSISGAIPPGAKKEFAIDCGSKKTPLGAYDKYTVEIANAYKA